MGEQNTIADRAPSVGDSLEFERAGEPTPGISGADLAEILCRAATTVGSGAEFRKSFRDAMQRRHRTEQQQVFGLFLTWAYGLAADADAGLVDQRNYAAAQKAKKIRDALGDWGWHVPLV